MKRLIGPLCVGVLVVVGFGIIAWASMPSGVTATVLARGTYEPFKVNTGPESLVDFQAKSKSHLDIVVRRHEYAVGGSTGWHTHPGPVFITVVQGELTFYEADDRTCTPKFVSAGQGYVDDGHGHIAINQSGRLATDISVILAPVNLPFRGELPVPNPYCGF